MQAQLSNQKSPSLEMGYDIPEPLRRTLGKLMATLSACAKTCAWENHSNAKLYHMH